MVVLVETKGDDRDNSDSKAKLDLGNEWQKKAGTDKYKYYMVFQSKDPGYAGAYSYDKFMEIVKEL